jgi:ELWxxDGT repeat protein
MLVSIIVVMIQECEVRCSSTSMVMKDDVGLIDAGSCRVRIFFVIAIFLLQFTWKNGLGQELIKDLNQSENPEVNEYAQAVDVDGSLFFNSFNDLWVTKGSTGTTIRLKRFTNLGQIVRVGSQIFFAAETDAGLELWKSNGTVVGTVMVKDIFPGPTGSVPEQLTAVGSNLYFVADHGISGREIWKSDGSTAGTFLVKDIIIGKGSSNPSFLTHSGGKLFFVANDAVHSYELWKSDGTSSGTSMVKDIVPLVKSGSFPKFLTDVNSVLFFTADDKISGRELWKSDGTASGTVLLRDIVAGGTATRMNNFVAVGNTLFFSADDKIHGEELWKSNGSTSGTLMVKDLTPGPGGSGSRGDFGHLMASFTDINGILYFSAYLKATYYFWKSDGTSDGTVPFYKPILDALMSPTLLANFTLLNDNVYFNDVARDQQYQEVFVSVYTMKEDTAGNISKISSLILWDFYDSRNQFLLHSGANLYMTGRKGIAAGYALFKSDGNTQAQLVVDAYSQKDQSGSPDLFTKIGNLIYFKTSFDYGLSYVLQSLWVTDGTKAGTRKLIELNLITEMAIVNNVLYFIGSSSNGYNIYRSDGTIQGTSSLKIPRPPDTYFLSRLNVFKGQVYYFWSRYSNEPESLWVKNETGIQQLGVFQNASGLVAAGNYLYFTSYTAEFGTELYKSDGTVIGTTLVEDIFPGGKSSSPTSLTSYKNYLFFSANDGTHGNELWRSNGSAAGTLMLKSLSATNSTNGRGGVQHFQIVNGQLFFTSDDFATSSLWKSDGTSAGTSQVSHIHRPLYLINGGTDLYFVTAFEDQFELWKNDDMMGSQIKLLESPTLINTYNGKFDYTTKNNVIYFANGSGLFQSDGSICGTFQVSVSLTDVFPISQLGSDLIFGGRNPSVGNELFKLAMGDIPNPCANRFLSDSDTINPTEFISIYPNPFTTDFTLRVNSAEGNSSVGVFDMKQNEKRTVESLTPNEVRSFGADWPPGHYLITVVTNGRKKYFRIVKRP